MLSRRPQGVWAQRIGYNSGALCTGDPGVFEPSIEFAEIAPAALGLQPGVIEPTDPLAMRFSGKQNKLADDRQTTPDNTFKKVPPCIQNPSQTDVASTLLRRQVVAKRIVTILTIHLFIAPTYCFGF
jgi:hypothetical protein